MNKLAWLIFAISQIAIFSSCASVNKDNLGFDKVSEPQVIGNINSVLQIVEYSSFSCGHCRDAYFKFHKLSQEFPEKIRLEFKVVALDSKARAPAAAALVAARYDKFWQASDYLFSNQDKLGLNLYRNLAISLGLNSEEFLSQMGSSEIRNIVSRNTSQAYSLGISVTPTIIINSSVYAGDRSIEKWREIIKIELNKIKNSNL